MRSASPAAATEQPRAHVIQVGRASPNATAPQKNPNATRRRASHLEMSGMRGNHGKPLVDCLKDFIQTNFGQTR